MTFQCAGCGKPAGGVLKADGEVFCRACWNDPHFGKKREETKDIFYFEYPGGAGAVAYGNPRTRRAIVLGDEGYGSPFSPAATENYCKMLDELKL